MKVIKTTATDNRLTSEIDLFSDVSLSKDTKDEVAKEVGEFLVESILKTVSGSKSPVEGESWPKLSQEYKKFKESMGAGNKPNMELNGDMLDALTFKQTKNGIELGFFGKEAPKADGHNNFSGESTLAEAGKQRRFLPDEGQEFVKSIQSEAEKIIKDAVVGSQNLMDILADVETKKELWETLNNYYPELTRSEIVGSIKRSPSMMYWFIKKDFAKWL